MKQPMKKSHLIALSIGVFALLWIMSGVLLPSSKDDEVIASEVKEETIFEVRVRSSKAKAIINDVELTGRTHASRSVDLKAETEGQVTKVIAEKGSEVKETDLIAELEEQDRSARLAEASERLEQRQIEYNAAKSLENKGFNSKVRLAQAAADLEEAKAVLEKAKLDLENTKIIAPFDGIIYEQEIEIGDYVSPGNMMFSIVDLDPIDVRGFATEQQVRQIDLGSKADVVFTDGSKAQATLSYIAPVANPQTRTFAIELELENAQKNIVEGMTVQISIPGLQKSAHSISPSVLSLNDAGQVGVKIVSSDNKVEFKPVVILSDRPDYMLVEGLPEKANIITVGQDFVVEGQLVKPVLAEGDGLL